MWYGEPSQRATIEHVRDSPKVNVFCAVSSCKVYRPFFFAEATVTGINYLDMLQLWLMSQLQEDSEHFTFQHDGTLPHFHFDVRAHLNTNLPGRWIRRASHNDSPLLTSPPRSPYLTLCDFFLWGYIKDRVYMSPCATWFTTAATKDCGGSRCYQPPDVATCVAGTWLQDWHLPHHQGWTHWAPVRLYRNLECLFLCWHAPLQRDHPSYCTAEVGNPGGTYKLPCTFFLLLRRIFLI